MQKQMNTPELKLKQDVCTRWNSTYEMLERVLKIKDALIATLALTRSDLALSSEDWALIEKVVPILHMIYEVTNEISQEKAVSLSKVIVYCRLLSRHLNQLLSHAEAEGDESQTYSLLQALNEQLHRRFGNIETSMICKIDANMLDDNFGTYVTLLIVNLIPIDLHTTVPSLSPNTSFPSAHITLKGLGESRISLNHD